MSNIFKNRETPPIILKNEVRYRFPFHQFFKQIKKKNKEKINLILNQTCFKWIIPGKKLKIIL